MQEHIQSFDFSYLPVELKRIFESQLLSRPELTLNFNINSSLDQLLKFLKSNPSIACLRIIGSQVSIQLIAKIIEQNTTLRKISIEMITISLPDAVILANALEKNTTVQTLSLKTNCISSTKVIKLISKNANLKTLELINNTISIQGIIDLINTDKLTHLTVKKSNSSYFASNLIAYQSKLKQAFENNRKLITLNLSDNYIGDEGTIALVNALNNNQTLTHLDVSSNSIGSKGMTALAKNGYLNLKKLSLAYNFIKEEDVEALTKALQNNTCLQELDLCWTGLKEAGIILLAEALKNQSSLEHLNLSENFISNNALEKWKEIIPHNPALLTVEIDHNRCPQVSTGIIKKLLDKNIKKRKSKIIVGLYPHFPDELINLVINYATKEESMTSEEIKVIFSEDKKVSSLSVHSASFFGRSSTMTSTSSQEAALSPSPKQTQ